VLQWLNWAIHEFSLENVVRSQFCLSGGRLLQLSRDEFLRRAPPFVGDILYEHLDVLQKGQFTRCSHALCSPSLSVSHDSATSITAYCADKYAICRLTFCAIHCVSKNDTDVAHCNFNPH